MEQSLESMSEGGSRDGVHESLDQRRVLIYFYAGGGSFLWYLFRVGMGLARAHRSFPKIKFQPPGLC